jgi:two-component system response regulator DesR
MEKFVTMTSVVDDGGADCWPASTIRVVLADAHPLVSAGLCALLGSQSDIEVTATVFRGKDVAEACRRALPALVILDARPPDLDAISVAMSVRIVAPATKFLLLASSGHPAELHAAMRAGVDGYLRKDVTPNSLFDAIRRIVAGHQVFDPAIVAHAMSRRHDVFALTASELRTLKMVASGLSNREIADRLRLSYGTVRNYVSSLITKTNARNRVDAIRIARELAWI